MPAELEERAFPNLDEQEMRMLSSMADIVELADGDVLFDAGQSDIDFFTVERGQVAISNPSDDGAQVAVHGPGQFIGDIDLLTRRPVVVRASAVGPTRLLRVPGAKFRQLLNTIPRIGEKIMIAFQTRRDLLSEGGKTGLSVIGAGHCADTNLIREFLQKNFVPFRWFDTDTEEGRQHLNGDGPAPVIDCRGQRLKRPTLQQLAEAAGVWRHCPDTTVDLAIIGAGPAGMTAAVYAASEGLSVLVTDQLGPGGQAGGSSKIENFIGFPAGLSGTELATRGVLQMLKFGAQLVAPVAVTGVKQIDHKVANFAVQLDCGSSVLATNVLAATGVTWRRLGAKGARRFERAGIYYACTAIEALLHEGQDVAVVGGGNSAGQAAMFLSEHCAKNVHILLRGQALRSTMSDYLLERIELAENIHLHTGVEIEEVVGERAIEHVILKRKGAEQEQLDVKAIFVFIGAEPRTDWLSADIARDERGYLLTGAEVVRDGQWPLTDRDPCPLETSIPGLFAAGDIRSSSTKRVGFAVGDGSLAVTCVHQFRGMKKKTGPVSEADQSPDEQAAAATAEDQVVGV